MATISVYKPLHCPFCFKNFTIPRVLPCNHTFCEKCLGTHIESQVQAGTKFMCPLCASPTVPVDSKLAIEKWASAFPLNTLICSVLESSGPQVNNCEPCENDGLATKAEFWCKDCPEKMCSSCKNLHKRNTLMKHHVIVPIDEMDQHQQPNIYFDQECCLHRDKMALFCVDHRELCCAVCVAFDHRQCKDVRSIDDIARDQLQRSKFDYSSIILDIAKLKMEMEKILTDKKNNAKQVLEEKEEIIRDMDDRIDRIIARLNTVRNIFKNDTERLYQDTKNSVLENEEIIRRFMTNVQNSGEILEIMEKNGTPQQQFATFENFRRQISSHYCQLKFYLNDDTKVHIAIKKSQVLNNLEGMLDSLGTVDITKQACANTRDVLLDTDRILKNLDSRSKVSTEMSAAQVEKKDLMTSPVTFVKSVTRQKLGSNIWFTGGTYTADGRLVMADCNNKRLVELDDEYNMVKEYKIDCPPTDVAAGNKDNKIYIAVDEKYIYKCKLHTNLTIVSRIKTPSGSWGIAESGDNIIVGSSSAVVILTHDGSTVRSIPTAYESGYYGYLSVSQTQRTVYHKDNDDVVCRTWEGQEVFRYQHEELKGPRGICIDSDRNVFVCGHGSYNVHQVTHDGQRSRIIQLHNISQPWNVVVHPQKKELLVTSFNEDTVCEVYRYG